MSNTTISPNMSLPVPIVGTDPGPQYAIDVDSCLAIIDAHNHTPGNGVQIPPGGININTSLTFNNNSAIQVQTVRFQSQNPAIPATGSNLGCIYEGPVTAGANGDLYYNDGVGNQIQITSSGHVNSGAGSISGLVSPASASYNSISKTFVFQSDVSTPANLDAASIVLRNLVASSPGLTLSPPTLGGDYTITLPALPGSNLPVSINNAGTMSAAAITFAQLATAVQQIIYTAPTVQVFTSGSGTYTLPSGPAPLYIEVEMVGGGGGGAEAGTGAATGGDTTFGSSFLTAGGGGGAGSSTPGIPGTASISGSARGIALSGGAGAPSSDSGGFEGGNGGSSALGGAGSGGPPGGGGGSGAANTGGGGGGSGVSPGGGGGAGGYVCAIVPSPSSTYAYSVGAGGGGDPGGGSGGSGVIIVREYYGA